MISRKRVAMSINTSWQVFKIDKNIMNKKFLNNN